MFKELFVTYLELNLNPEDRKKRELIKPFPDPAWWSKSSNDIERSSGF